MKNLEQNPQNLNDIKSEEVLLMYQDENNFAYKVIANQNKGVSLFKGGLIPNDFLKRSTIGYVKMQEFISPDDFWTDFTKDELWFKTYSPFYDNEMRKPSNNYFAFYILRQANKIRNSLAIEWTNYTSISIWEAAFKTYEFARHRQVQVCSNCMARVRFYPRYPTAICRACTKKITDKDGRSVFYVLDTKTARCKGQYENQEAYKERICYIGEKEFFVTEARMSGMVIQLLSAKKYMI